MSAQTSSRSGLEEWKQRVRHACISAWQQGKPLADPAIGLRVTIFRKSELGDLDNLAKPIVDALQGVVYQNDRQISDLMIRRRDIDSAFKVRYMWRALAMAFIDGKQFVHIEVWRNPDQESLC